MHPGLSPHLHTEECNVLINLLKESHKHLSILRFFCCSYILITGSF
uniref:Uncharacterized protein n=3 Tax=Canis lupus TaxID=9612 RepID=A0A8C0Z5D5_CANLF